MKTAEQRRKELKALLRLYHRAYKRKTALPYRKGKANGEAYVAFKRRGNTDELKTSLDKRDVGVPFARLTVGVRYVTWLSTQDINTLGDRALEPIHLDGQRHVLGFVTVKTAVRNKIVDVVADGWSVEEGAVLLDYVLLCAWVAMCRIDGEFRPSSGWLLRAADYLAVDDDKILPLIAGGYL